MDRLTTVGLMDECKDFAEVASGEIMEAFVSKEHNIKIDAKMYEESVEFFWRTDVMRLTDGLRIWTVPY